jgi:hypothetical protein
MAIRRNRFEYTVYPPSFTRDRDQYHDFRTAARTRRIARSLGVGARIYRTINHVEKGVAIDKFWDDKVFEWSGAIFKDITSKITSLMKSSDWSS